MIGTSHHRQARHSTSGVLRLHRSNKRKNNYDCIRLKREKECSNHKISALRKESSGSGNECSTYSVESRLSITTATVPCEIASETKSGPKHARRSERTTKMLVICSTAFLVFNSPYCGVLLYSIISEHVLKRTLDTLRHFYFMSFCFNFFLYSLCGSRFRRELVLLLKTYYRKCCLLNFCQKRAHFDNISHLPPSSVTIRVDV